MKTRIALLFGVFAVLLALFLLSQREESDRLTGEELKALGLVELPERRPVENLDLVDQNGNPFDGSALIGKWTFAFLRLHPLSRHLPTHNVPFEADGTSVS